MAAIAVNSQLSRLRIALDLINSICSIHKRLGENGGQHGHPEAAVGLASPQCGRFAAGTLILFCRDAGPVVNGIEAVSRGSGSGVPEHQP
jgi:hypothetical protein